MRNSKELQNEINSFATSVKNLLGNDSKEYHDCTYYLSILHEYYICPDSQDSISRDILSNLKGLILKLSSIITDFQSGQIEKVYPNVVKMITTLDSELPTD